MNVTNKRALLNVTRAPSDRKLQLQLLKAQSLSKNCRWTAKQHSEDAKKYLQKRERKIF